jgi:pimeloyl-ACP methyl ester carboxylesterase
MTQHPLRGAVRLVTDATAGLTDLVEAVHERITRLPGVPAPADDGRTSGITGLVYKSIRGVTRLVGGSLDALLQVLTPDLTDSTAPASAESSYERAAVLAALNGVLGDYLASSHNPLATPMTLRLHGQPLSTAPASGNKLLVLVHGLCMNDLQWQHQGHDHGAALARDLGYTPVYVRYNSGQHISLNGRELAAQLGLLLAEWPEPLTRVVLLGHSMGGLVLRSALHQATMTGQAWPQRVDDLVFLGTPHTGAPLERAGNGVDVILGETPLLSRYTAPFARLGKLRSAGITDLRHAALLDEDWAGRDRFARSAPRCQPVPLPTHLRSYAVAASTGRHSGDIKDSLLGDGLVPLASALGQQKNPARSLVFAADRQAVFWETNHLDLLGSPAVYAQLRKWLA